MFIFLKKIFYFFYREFKVNISGFHDILTNITFFFISIFIFIFSIGPQDKILSVMGVSILWTLLLLSSTLSLTKFYRDDFNNYKECIWWPHRDTGYNGIVYFSDECGTNLYSPDYFDKSKRITTYEHKTPWVKKGEFKLLKTLEPKYNRLVFFDGLKFPHGMDICNDRFFDDEYRYNQVFFFNHPNYTFIDREQDI